MGILPLPYSARIDAINTLVDGFIKLESGMPVAATLANIALTGSASDLTTGTLADARLSSNVPLKNAASNVFTGNVSFGGTIQVGGASGPLLKNSSGTLQVRNSADSAFATAEMDQGRVHTRLRVGTLPASSYPLEVNGYGQAYESTAIATGWLSRNSLSQWGAQVSSGGDWEVMQYLPSVFRRLWVTQAGEVYTQNQQTTASATNGNSLTIRAIASQTGRLLRFANVSNADVGFVGVDGSASFNGGMVVGGNTITGGGTSSKDPTNIILPFSSDIAYGGNGSLALYNSGQIYLGDNNFRSAAYWNSAPGIGAVGGPPTAELAFYVYTGSLNSRTEAGRFKTNTGLQLGGTSGNIFRSSGNSMLVRNNTDTDRANVIAGGFFGNTITRDTDGALSIDSPGATGTIQFRVGPSYTTGMSVTNAGNVQIGGTSGPVLRNNAGTLDVRDSANTGWGQVNALQYTILGYSYSRVAQLVSAGTWGGGYNINFNGAVANRDSTGTVTGVWYSSSDLRFYAEPSGSPAAINPRLTLSPTLLSMSGSVQAQSASDTTKGLLCRNSGATGNALGQMMIGHPGWYDNQLLLMHDGAVVANMSSTFFIVQKAAQILAGAAVTGQVSITGSNSINSGVFLSNMASTLGRTGRVLIGWPGNYDDQLLMYHGSTLFANISDSTVNFTRTVGVQNQSGTDTQIVNTNNGNNAINWSSTGVPGTRITALTDMRLAINYVDRVTLTNALFSVIPNATFGGTVQVGGASGHLLKRNVDELQIRDSTDAAWRDIQARVARFNSAGGQTLVINGTDIAGGGSYMYLTSGSTHLYLRTNAAASQPLTLINSTCIFAPNVWHGDSVNLTRFLFSGNGASYYKGFGLVPHEWRNAAESFIMRLSDTGDLTTLGYITSAFQSLSADPSTLDISSGMSRLVKNTTANEIRHWVNDGGTMKKSGAYT